MDQAGDAARRHGNRGTRHTLQTGDVDVHGLYQMGHADDRVDRHATGTADVGAMDGGVLDHGVVQRMRTLSVVASRPETEPACSAGLQFYRRAATALE